MKEWPAWRYGPGEASGIFESEGDVPKGWVDHPSKLPAPRKAKTLGVDTNMDAYESIREIEEGLAAGKITVEDVERVEMEREKPRAGVLKIIERERAKTDALLSREDALAMLRESGFEIADDASDEEIEAALSSLE
jgi:hypothetical protein